MGNVLLDFDFKPALLKLSRHSGVPVQTIADYYNQSGLEVLFDGGKITNRQFYSQARRALNLSLSYEQFAAIWNGIFKPDQKIGRLVQKLSRTHRLVLLSNTNSMHARYIEKRYPGLMGLFDKRLYSFREKRRKPDAGLYRTALRACKAPANQVFYIDDRADFTGAAEELGIHTFTYRKNFSELVGKIQQLGALSS